MVKAEMTGNRRNWVAEEGPVIGGPVQDELVKLPWYYEIEVEWVQYPVPGGLDLYRRSSPGAYPNGTMIAWNVTHFDQRDCYLDPDFGYSCNYYYHFYDWAREGYTWYYMAEYSSDEVSVTVP